MYELCESVLEKLRSKHLTLSCAESCTGGTVAKMITDVSGASAVFDMGVTTYSNESKMRLLGVSAETLESFGAVSEQTAREMAQGALKLANADIAISVTGIAGPNSDGSKKAVGTVCIGLATAEKCYATTFLFSGTRAEIRKLSARMACRIALEEMGGAVKMEPKKKITAKAGKITAKAATKTKKVLSKIIKKDKKTIDNTEK
jgi:PncC family amidohydrolase